jgi:hypothetical protein
MLESSRPPKIGINFVNIIAITLGQLMHLVPDLK